MVSAAVAAKLAHAESQVYQEGDGDEAGAIQWAGWLVGSEAAPALLAYLQVEARAAVLEHADWILAAADELMARNVITGADVDVVKP